MFPELHTVVLPGSPRFSLFSEFRISNFAAQFPIPAHLGYVERDLGSAGEQESGSGTTRSGTTAVTSTGG